VIDVYLRTAPPSLGSWMTAASRLIGIYKIVSFINEDILRDTQTYIIEYIFGIVSLPMLRWLLNLKLNQAA